MSGCTIFGSPFKHDEHALPILLSVYGSVDLRLSESINCVFICSLRNEPLVSGVVFCCDG